jgi:hypothetical protein
MRATGPASERKHGPLGQGPDQTHGHKSDNANIEGKSNHDPNIGMEQLTCHHRNDRNRCERVTEALRQYRREYDDRSKDWRKNPLHDWTSHGADALWTFACGHDDSKTTTSSTLVHPHLITAPDRSATMS